MPDPVPASPEIELDRFRPYLQLLARLQMRREIQAKVDPSDVVQLTLLNAHQAREGFRGTTESELAGWLRQILARNLARVSRDLGRDKRNVDRERSLQAQLDESSLRLEAWLASDESSPSQRASRNEEVVRLAAAVARLPEAQRTAIELHYFQGWTIAQVGDHLEKSTTAAAGLLHRGLVALRTELRAGPQGG
jgi:RNA polymerase sigma-70 factor (ECF subfamily)